MNIEKQAAKDAFEFVRSDMYYGEGAGTRRKLIDTIVAARKKDIPGYEELFEKAVQAQDWAEHAIEATKERKRIDRAAVLKRNLKGVATGNRRQLTAGVATAFGIYMVLHETGLDDVIKHEAKDKYRKGKAWVNMKRTEARAARTGRKLKSVPTE